jgi:hypothetical protein
MNWRIPAGVRGRKEKPNSVRSKGQWGVEVDQIDLEAI